MTDGGTLIMRRLTPDSARAALGETTRFNSPSIAPFSVDIEDDEPPARNSDVLGTRSTQTVDYSRTTTPTSFFAGLTAGLVTLALSGVLAYASMVDPYGASASSTTGHRARHQVVHAPATLTVVSPDVAEQKVAKGEGERKHRVKRVRKAAAAAEETTAESPAEAPLDIPAPAPAQLPQAGDSE